MAQFYYGGQAVIEGVMMRGRRQATVCVRDREGGITSRTEALPHAIYGSTWAHVPMIRGLLVLWEMLALGMRAMLFSANVHTSRNADQPIPRRAVILTIGFSLTFAVGVFFVLPLLLTRVGGHAVHGSVTSNLYEGGVRLALFLGYILLVGRMEKMQRVFQYHGAEHKTVNAFEAGATLTPSSVQRYSVIHIRCGTAFLLWVVVLSILVFSLIGHQTLLVSILLRVVLVPVIAAAGYEVLRLGARFYHVAPVRIALQPGLWLQRLTTREPTDDQVEVAIAALLPVLHADGLLRASAKPIPAN